MLKKLKWSTAREVREGLARVANMLLNEEIEPRTANAVCYCASQILASIRTDEQQQRIDELAAAVAELEAEK